MTTNNENTAGKEIEQGKPIVKKPWYKSSLFIILVSAFFIAMVLKAFIIEAYRIPSSSMEDTLLPGDLIVVNKLAYALSTPAFLPFVETPVKPKSLWRYSAPSRFEVITFLHPGEREEFTASTPTYYIKRVYGLPGEKIKIVRKHVFINDRELPQGSYVKFHPDFCMPGIGNERIFPKGTDWNEDYYGPFVVPAKGMKVELNFENFQKYRLIINREYGQDVIRWSGGKVLIRDTAAQFYEFRNNYYFVMGDNRDDSFDSRFWGLVPEGNISGRALIIYMSLDQFGQGFFDRIRWKRMMTLIH